MINDGGKQYRDDTKTNIKDYNSEMERLKVEYDQKVYECQVGFANRKREIDEQAAMDALEARRLARGSIWHR